MPNLIGGILLGFTWQFIFVQVFEAKKIRHCVAAGLADRSEDRFSRITDRSDLAVVGIYDDDLHCTDPEYSGFGNGGSRD